MGLQIQITDTSELTSLTINQVIPASGQLKIQRFFASELMRKSDPYVPFKSGVLKNSAKLKAGTYDAIIYDTPYATYQYIGQLYVDPYTLKGAFHDKLTGRFWSRPNTAKIPDPMGRMLTYNGAPMRGSNWVERAWIDNQEQIEESTKKYIEKGLWQ